MIAFLSRRRFLATLEAELPTTIKKASIGKISYKEKSTKFKQILRKMFKKLLLIIVIK